MTRRRWRGLEAINHRVKDGGILFSLSGVKGPVMDRLKGSHFPAELSGNVRLIQYEAASGINPDLPHRALTAEKLISNQYAILKDFVRQVRPVRHPAFLRLEFGPGECAQVDWGSFGAISVGSTRRRLSFFVMVLCHSRLLYVEFTLSEGMGQFLTRIALAWGAAVAPIAQAGGIQLYEIGTPEVGLAAAGYAARAQDASTVFKNPAGMSRLEGTQFQGGLQVLYGSVEFSSDGTTSLSLGDNHGGVALGALPAASLFFSQALSERFAVGFGTFSYFGLAEDYDDHWAGRYYAQKNVLLGMSLMPAVSFQVNEWLSIGAGLNAMYGYLDSEVAIRTGAPEDGQLKLKDEVWGFGANAGVLITPREGTRFGVTYLSPVDLDFEHRPSFSNLGPLGGAIFANPRGVTR